MILVCLDSGFFLNRMKKIRVQFFSPNLYQRKIFFPFAWLHDRRRFIYSQLFFVMHNSLNTSVFVLFLFPCEGQGFLNFIFPLFSMTPFFYISPDYSNFYYILNTRHKGDGVSFPFHLMSYSFTTLDRLNSHVRLDLVLLY